MNVEYGPGQIDLSGFAVGSIPSQYFLPEFITEEEEKKLIRNIEQAPRPKWTNLSNRRLQNWGGLPAAQNGTMLEEPLPLWLQWWCDTFKQRLFTQVPANDGQESNPSIPFFSKPPNHVLINKYLPGQGIMPHEDGPIYHSFVAVLNLNSSLMLDIYRRNEDKTLEQQGSAWMEQRSLWMMTDELYENYLHGIQQINSDSITPSSVIFNKDRCGPEFQSIIENVNETQETTEIQRETRYSMTFRIVTKSRKINANLFSFVSGKK